MSNLEIYNLYSYVKLNYIHKKLWRSVMDNKNIQQTNTQIYLPIDNSSVSFMCRNDTNLTST